MGTTSYYEADLPVGDLDIKRTRKIEVMVSSFFGTPELYLRVDDDEEGTVLLDRDQARALLDGLESAMSYLGYTR